MAKKVFIVAYDPETVRRQKQQFESEGCKVVSALSYRIAIEFIRTFHYDLLVLGESVPVADKETVIAEFNQRQPGSAILCLDSQSPPANPSVEVHPKIESASEIFPYGDIQISRDDLRDLSNVPGSR